ncbi:hypothetical protein RRG08_047925 [Elysia crispata]|uniref:Uncharacterized protein n=1 Tax=Elysia crispata TaxID=231223 RepID=A0AAE1DI73_9GAST|nr:hypothetical protein RRG08_047925 [Elysia crispata]
MTNTCSVHSYMRKKLSSFVGGHGEAEATVSQQNHESPGKLIFGKSDESNKALRPPVGDHASAQQYLSYCYSRFLYARPTRTHHDLIPNAGTRCYHFPPFTTTQTTSVPEVEKIIWSKRVQANPNCGKCLGWWHRLGPVPVFVLLNERNCDLGCRALHDEWPRNMGKESPVMAKQEVVSSPRMKEIRKGGEY